MDKKEFHNFIMTDVLSHIEGVASRAMFGGYGIYKDGYIFGLIADNVLLFKVDETNEGQYKKYGSQYFVYSGGNHKETRMPYMSVPDEILENKEEIEKWANQSVAITKKKKSNKKQ